MVIISSHTFAASKGPIHYLAAGPTTGPLIVFDHGCPFIAMTWRPQLECFANLGFHVAAADTTGYGQSFNSREVSDYSMEFQVADQLELLSHLGREKAIFVGHDWGSAIIWSLAAHHPENCLGVAALDRELYPETKYPYGQWDYMLYYEQNPEKVVAYFAQHFERLTKLFTTRYDGPRKASITADLTKTGEFFGGQAPPDVPFEASVLDHEMFNAAVASERNNGQFGIVAYYRNGAANRAYNDPKRCAKGAKLDIPCFYLDCSADLASVNSSSTDWTAEMHELCSNIFEVQLDCRHMVALEKPTETNALLARWLCEHTQAWPVDRSSGILKPGNA